ncbi:cytochrome-c peroxidase [Tenacibaculum agarivorans]|uniref:cytochrome-c peroxidase n=1 Tax=Tenacibaculum agarivorans TaxID=1908389 RepID=UPI00094BB439|nr:cytochrome c peroxidase [Tenacibaculum agarivorans]
MNRFTLFTLLLSICFSCKNSSANPDGLNEGYAIVTSYKRPIEEWPSPTIDKGVEWEEMKPLRLNKTLFEDMKKADVILGKTLFFDPRLSSSNQISCSSCHHPEMGWTTHTEKSIGHNRALSKRNAPSLFNVFSKNNLFWDGRSLDLEDQALQPIKAHDEMNMDPKKLPSKIYKIKGYRQLFQDAFNSDEISVKKIVKALAAFQRTIKSQSSRVDGFMRGRYDVLNDNEIKGLHLFRTKARCMNCHNGEYLTDQNFHNIGLTYYKREEEDLGLYNITKKAKDVGKFSTPSLRDLLNTRPWMHNGLFHDLIGIVNIYNSGMQMVNPRSEGQYKDSLHPVTDSLIQPLGLTEKEIEDLAAFLKALNGTKYKMPIPKIPE